MLYEAVYCAIATTLLCKRTTAPEVPRRLDSGKPYHRDRSAHRLDGGKTYQADRSAHRLRGNAEQRSSIPRPHLGRARQAGATQPRSTKISSNIHGYEGSYDAVKRLARKLRKTEPKIACRSRLRSELQEKIGCERQTIDDRRGDIRVATKGIHGCVVVTDGLRVSG